MTDWFFDPLPSTTRYRHSAAVRLFSDAGVKRSALAHYDVMSAEQIRALSRRSTRQHELPDLFVGDGSASPVRC